MKQLVLFFSLFACASSYAQVIQKRIYVNENKDNFSTTSEEGRARVQRFLSRPGNTSIDNFVAYNQFIDSGKAQEIIRNAQASLSSYLERQEFAKDNYGLGMKIKTLGEVIVALSIEYKSGVFKRVYLELPTIYGKFQSVAVSDAESMEDALASLLTHYVSVTKDEIDAEEERLRKLSIINLDDFSSLNEDQFPHINDEGREFFKDIQDKDQTIKNTPRALEA